VAELIVVAIDSCGARNQDYSDRHWAE
jgi:hypothetical protein